ncbi:MAG: hypothetical protein RLZZ520_1650, partial [Bacteroidota bacterium]
MKTTRNTEQIESWFVFLTIPKTLGMTIEPGALLKHINSPDDLKKLSKEELYKVCDELRQYIIDVVSI